MMSFKLQSLNIGAEKTTGLPKNNFTEIANWVFPEKSAAVLAVR